MRWSSIARSRASVFTGVSIMGLALAACGSSSPSSSGGNNSNGTAGASSKSPITLGVDINLSGVDSAWDGPTNQAFDLYIKKVNAAGGINGRKIKLITLNAASSETTAVSNLHELISQDHVLAVFGFGDTLEANACLPIAAATNETAMTVSWGTANLKSPYLFQISNNITYSSNVLIHYLASHYSHMVLTAANNSRGQEELQVQATEMKKAGFTGKIAQFYYQPTATNFTPLAEQIKAENPQIIFNNGTSAANVVAPMKAARAIGVTAPWAGPTMAIPNVVTVGSPSLLAGSLTSIFVTYSKPQTKTLATLVKKTFNKQINYGYVQGWDAATLFVDALKKTGATANTTALRNALESLQNVKVVGGPPGYTVSFGKQGGLDHAGYTQTAMSVQEFTKTGGYKKATT